MLSLAASGASVDSERARRHGHVVATIELSNKKIVVIFEDGMVRPVGPPPIRSGITNVKHVIANDEHAPSHVVLIDVEGRVKVVSSYMDSCRMDMIQMDEIRCVIAEDKPAEWRGNIFYFHDQDGHRYKLEKPSGLAWLPMPV